MRKPIDEQLKFGEGEIAQISFDSRSRDEISQLLMGLKRIYCTPELRDAVFDMLNAPIVLWITGPASHIRPYLLRNLEIDRPNQLWCTDISYIPMARGYLYLTVIMDWYSRRILSWRLSSTMNTSFCLAALHEALKRTGKTPEIINTDQGCQYASAEWIAAVESYGAKVSMDEKNAGSTTSWSSLSDERSSTTKSTCAPTPTALRRDTTSADSLTTTTPVVPINTTTCKHPIRSMRAQPQHDHE